MELLKIISVIKKQKHPFRFLFATFLNRIRTPVFLKYRFFKDYFLKIAPSTLSLHIWIGKYDISKDISLIEKIVKDNFVYVDIGSNIGHLSIVMAYKAYNGIVISIEPQSKIFFYLNQNIKLNKLKNVISLNFLIDEKEGIRDFIEYDYADDQSSFKVSNLNWKYRVEKKIALRLDNLLSIIGIEKIDFLKIDVEGDELNVLKSLGEKIKDVSYIWFEHNVDNYKLFGYTSYEVFDYLRENDFDFFDFEFENAQFKVLNTLSHENNLLAVNKKLEFDFIKKYA